MTKSKYKVTKFKWDGKSRPVDDKYRTNYNHIFGDKEVEALKKSLTKKPEQLDADSEEYFNSLKEKL